LRVPISPSSSFNGPARPDLYTLSLHDALPIYDDALGAGVLHRAVQRGRRDRVDDDRLGAGLHHRVDLLDLLLGVGAGDLDLQVRSEEHTSELQSRENLVCRLLLEKKKK